MKFFKAYHWILLSVFFSGTVIGADLPRGLFSGGMFIQGGPARSENPYGEISGFMAGLGGRVHFYIGKHFRIGSAGASLSMDYSNPGLEDSYVQVGYGGILTELTHHFNKYRVSGGVLLGGARFSNLHIISHDQNDKLVALLDNRTSLVLTPLLSMERDISSSMALCVLLDFLYGPKLGDLHHFSYPRVHVGMLFNK